MQHLTPTIKDIAKHLGISTSTVSRAFNDSSEINPRTRAAVLAYAKEINYLPNKMAQNFKKQRTNIIGVLIPETINSFFSKALAGIQSRLNQENYQVILCQSNESLEGENRNLQTLLQSQVDGIIVSVSRETKDDAHFDVAIRNGTHVVFFDRILEGKNASTVISDNYEIVAKATNHLMETGCQRIAYIAGPQNLFNSKWRYEGFKFAMTQAGRPLREDYLISTHYDSEEVAQYTNRLLDLPEPPDGILAINDASAIQMIKVIQSRGFRIPEDVSIIGFNNDFYGQYSSPALSTIEIPVFKMGAAAASQIIQKINQPTTPNLRQTLYCNLILRGTTRALKPSAK